MPRNLELAKYTKPSPKRIPKRSPNGRLANSRSPKRKEDGQFVGHGDRSVRSTTSSRSAKRVKASTAGIDHGPRPRPDPVETVLSPQSLSVAFHTPQGQETSTQDMPALEYDDPADDPDKHVIPGDQSEEYPSDSTDDEKESASKRILDTHEETKDERGFWGGLRSFGRRQPPVSRAPQSQENDSVGTISALSGPGGYGFDLAEDDFVDIENGSKRN